MHIVFHHRTQGRGVEGVHIRGLVSGFMALGHTVEVLSAVGSELPAADELHAESEPSLLGKFLSAIARNAPQFVFELMEIAFNFLAHLRISRRLKAGNIDFIYERYSLFLVSTVRLAKKYNVPIVLEINDSAVVERVRPLFLRKIAKKFEQRIFRDCTGLVFVSEEFRKLCAEAHRDMAPSIVLPNCADISVFDSQKYDKDAEKSRHGLAGKIVCGYVGAFIPWHGIDWFVELAVERLAEAPELALLLVGDGAVYDEVREVVRRSPYADRVVFAGRVAHAEVPRLISAMDFAILPDSNNYGSPMKVFELMAMGVPVVAPAYPPLVETIVDSEEGWLFPAGDRTACVNLFLEVARKPIGDIKGVAAGAVEKIVKERQWSHNAQRTTELALREVG